MNIAIRTGSAFICRTTTALFGGRTSAAAWSSRPFHINMILVREHCSICNGQWICLRVQRGLLPPRTWAWSTKCAALATPTASVAHVRTNTRSVSSPQLSLRSPGTRRLAISRFQRSASLPLNCLTNMSAGPVATRNYSNGNLIEVFLIIQTFL